MIGAFLLNSGNIGLLFHDGTMICVTANRGTKTKMASSNTTLQIINFLHNVNEHAVPRLAWPLGAFPHYYNF